MSELIRAEMTAEAMADDTDRPTAGAALFALPVAPMWTAGLLLFACLWLPQFTGCDGVDVRPIDRMARASDIGEQVATVCLLWPHWFGLLTAVALIAVAVVRPVDPGRWLLIAPATIWLGLLGASCVALLLDPPQSGRQWLEMLLWLPVLLAPGVWAGIPLRRRQWLSAWARLTSLLALLAYPMLVLSTFPGRGSLYGLTVALVAAAALAPLAWVVRWRGRKVLADRSAPTEPIRFRLSHLIVYTTVVAATCGYYRLVPWLLQ